MPAQKHSRGEIAAVLLASSAAFASTALFSCLVNILMLTGPLFMLQVYDRVLTSGSVPTLVALTGIVIALYAYYGFLEYLRARILVRIGRRVEERLRDRVFDSMAEHALRPSDVGIGITESYAMTPNSTVNLPKLRGSTAKPTMRPAAARSRAMSAVASRLRPKSDRVLT